jgi:hypothetical protein
MEGLMATKKQNRRHVVRRTRRALNRTIGDVKGTRKGILRTWYGDGPKASSFKLREKDDDNG